MSDVTECPVCKGAGVVRDSSGDGDAGWVLCTACKGSGKVPVPDGCHDPGVFGHQCRGGRQSSEPPFLGQPMGPPVWLAYAMSSGAAGMVRGEMPRQGSSSRHETNRRAGYREDIR